MIYIILMLIDIIFLYDYHYNRIYFADIAMFVLVILLLLRIFLIKKINLQLKIYVFILIFFTISILYLSYIHIFLNVKDKFYTLLHLYMSILNMLLLMLNFDLFNKYRVLLIKNFKFLIILFSFCIILQFIFLNILHIKLDFSFGLMDAGGQRTFNKEGLLFRPSGLYVEPAHQVLILIYLAIIVIILDLRKYLWLILIDLILCLSTTGLVALIIIAIYEFYKYNIIKKFSFIFILFILLLSFKDSIWFSFSKLFEYNLQYSSSYVRLMGPLIINNLLNSINILFGIGAGQIKHFLILHDMYIFNNRHIANLGSNSFFHIYVSFGIFAELLFSFFKIYILLNSKNKFTILLLFLVIDFASDASFLGWYYIVLYFILWANYIQKANNGIIIRNS